MNNRRSMAVGASMVLAFGAVSTGTAFAAGGPAGPDTSAVVRPHDPAPVQLALSATKAPTGGVVTASVTTTYPGTDPLVGSIDFGDGSAPVSTLTTATHSYAAVGTYTVTATVTDGSGAPQTSTQTIKVVAPAPLHVQISTYASSALGLSVSLTPLTDSWNLTSGTIDFGDGTPPLQLVSNGAQVGQIATGYAKPGTYTITVHVTDAGGNTGSTQVQFTTNGSDYTAYGPTRILDTRAGIGAPVAKLQPGGVLRLKVAGTGSIPAGVTAVALNLTATDTAGQGFVTAYADGAAVPNVSNLNYSAGKTGSDAAIVPVGADGYVDLADQGGLAGAIDLLADVTGYFTQTVQSGYTPLSPARILDTRSGLGAPAGQVPAGGTTVLTVAGADGGLLPAAGVTAVALNLTATGTSGSGYVSAYPDTTSAPNISSLNYAPNQTIANSVIVPVGPDGKIDLTNLGALAGPVDLLADVTGYFSASGPDAYVAVAPTRILDTRGTAPVAAGGTTDVNAGSVIANLPGDFSYSEAAIVVNTTVTEPTGTGFATDYRQGDSLPNVSTVNYTPGLTASNLGLVTSDGGIAIHNGGAQAGTVQVIVDLFGYFASQQPNLA